VPKNNNQSRRKIAILAFLVELETDPEGGAQK
jgi:hypothetical protein